MLNYIVFFLMIIFVFGPGPVLAQYSNDKQGDESDAPSGMEARKVNGGVTVLMPKGGRMQRTNEITYVQESTDEYAARNFASVESRLDKLEKENRELQEDVKNMKSKLSSAENNAPNINKE